MMFGSALIDRSTSFTDKWLVTSMSSIIPFLPNGLQSTILMMALDLLTMVVAQWSTWSSASIVTSFIGTVSLSSTGAAAGPSLYLFRRDLPPGMNRLRKIWKVLLA